ncbi:histone-lysine N-methyltransferase NSD2-like isoform X2 [Ruditapes philippinarum]|uniref:histone-lysine N-methyltransferase NSD2-like isoform X2 n=1 Tax=Ruditapes philippinarum TaxID=129788 RepID=UPI00295B2816|nr:histone-lysine N-methyltransferase NSD2-like isoform X2 [Ruditapes philippinarum]
MSNIEVMASPQKPVLNGLDSAPAASGFRHTLPQIAVATRNPKISQTKAPVKVDVSGAEHATTDVEGVGKVVHIGSEVMDVDDSAEKKLLADLEAEVEDKENDKSEVKDKLDSKNDQNGKTSVEIKDIISDKNEELDKKEELTNSENAQNEKIEKDTSKDTSKSEEEVKKPITEQSVSEGKASGEQLKAESEGSSGKKESRGKRKSAENKQAPEKKSQTKSKAQTSPARDSSTKRQKQIKSPAVSEGNLSSDESSPNKRQRKPKKFEDDAGVDTKAPPKTPKTPVEKLTKPKPEVNPELEAKYPVKWLVGDMVWAKVTSHPWWPCMVSYDPFSALYTRINRCREYHVQFFGDAAERAWISMNNLLEFQGKDKFEEYTQGLYAASKSAKELKKLKEWYGVKPNRVKAVNIGIAQAETALPLNRQERKAKFTFVYKLPKGKLTESVSEKLKELDEDLKIIQGAEKAIAEDKPGKKRKHEEVETPSKTPKNTSSKRRKLETPKSESKVESPVKIGKRSSSSSRVKSATEGSFEVFCENLRGSMLLEHPEFTEDELMDYCRQQWCMMSKQQKARYKKTKRGESDLSDDMSPGAGRKRRPSQKVLEAEEDNKVVDEVISGKKPAPVKTEGKSSRRSRAAVDSPVVTSTIPTEQKESETKQSETKKKRGRPSKANTEVIVAEGEAESTETVVKTETKPENTTTDTEPDAKANTTVIPAKRARPKKSISTDSDKQVGQSESGRSTPDHIPDMPPPPKREKEEYEYEMEIYKLSSAAPQKKENLCQICEQTGELMECQGPCQGFFHMDCLGLTVAPEGAFKCDECTNGIHSCFVCKKSSADTQRCSVPVCGKFYHIDCIKQYPQAKVEGKGLTCPLHSCHTCLANNLKGSAAKSNGRLLRCVRCPTAFHVGDFCISAGSINLTGFNIVCAKHFQPIPSMKHHSHVNVSWCFSCNKGGTLLCCESCPAAYHAECLNIDFPTGSWYCQDCVKGKRPLYGEIIWVKLGNYRWWPGEVCHPRNVPLNIQEKAHQVGEFPVHFLGSHEFFWLHQGRVFSFQDGDKGNGGSSSNKGLAKHFAKGLKEAAEAFKVWKEFRENKEQLELAKESKKPAPFKMVKTNVPLGSVVIKKADLSELPRCDCKADQENPCGRDSECLNAMMMYECHPALCPAGDNCQNQFFTKRLYPSQQPYKTEGRGWGLKATVDIKKGQFVNEYVGDLIDEEECKRRLEKAHEDDIHNFYMMTLDMDRIIDAGPKGNLSRFMNHSCDPNLETQKWNVNGDVRVGLFALKDIKAGDELTFNYNFDCLGNEQTKCGCGSENCSGYLGVRPKSQHAAMAELKRKETKKGDKQKKKKKPVVKRKHDDDCFRCGEGGELVLCDRSSCPKSYHLRCLNLCKPPHGKWDCPWHHCDECGKPATKKCVECPNSFCSTHADDTKVRFFDNKVYCIEHEDLLDTLEESQSQTSAAHQMTMASLRVMRYATEKGNKWKKITMRQ